jgi:hypothetical protein
MSRRHMREWRYSSTILDLGTRWRWVVNFTTRPLYPRWNSPRYPLDRRLGGPQSRSGGCRKEKNHPLGRIWTQAVQPIALSVHWITLTSTLLMGFKVIEFIVLLITSRIYLLFLSFSCFQIREGVHLRWEETLTKNITVNGLASLLPLETTVVCYSHPMQPHSRIDLRQGCTQRILRALQLAFQIPTKEKVRVENSSHESSSWHVLTNNLNPMHGDAL